MSNNTEMVLKKPLYNYFNRSLEYYLIFIVLLLNVIFLPYPANGENFEFQLSTPMLITSLRTFEMLDDYVDRFISRPRNGSVILTADAGYGIMAVVQTMNLQDINDASNKAKCLDFIKMAQISGTEATKEICGNFETFTGTDLAEFKKPTFVDKKGQMEMSYVLTEKSRVTAIDVNVTNFNISFTPFTECPEESFPFGDRNLRPCSIMDTFSCISAEFFCDGVVNCGFPDEYGLDEINCPLSTETVETSDEGLDYNYSSEDLGDYPPNEEKSKEINVSEDIIIPLNGRPYIGYIKADNDFAFSKNITTSGSRFSYHNILLSSTRNYRALGGCSLLVIILSLYCVMTAKRLGRRRASNSILQRLEEVVIEIEADSSGNRGGATKGDSQGLISTYNVESDPTPSYDDSLLMPRSNVYSELSYDYEYPPSYEEVRVHQKTNLFK